MRKQAECAGECETIDTSANNKGFTKLYCSLDFREGCDLDLLARSMLTTGFQATNVGLAIQQINQMVGGGCLSCVIAAFSC